MALGFQRIHDLSPLSMKLLNDQMEQLWKKMMGGLETRDMTPPVARVIDTAVTEENFTSMIEQNAERIRLAVGSVPGENMVRNGNAAFGTEGWEAEGADLTIVRHTVKGDVFAVDGAGIVSQGPYHLNGDTRYALCFAYQSERPVSASVGEGIARGGEGAGGEGWKDYLLPFTNETACDAYIQLNFQGPAQFGEVMLARGDGSAWRQNPNEVKNSSVTLTDGEVSIDTRNFALRLYDGNGQAVTEMTADGQGFTRLYVAENLMLRGRPFYLGDGEHHLWVRPDAARTGERRIFSSGGEPVSPEGCFCDIQEAVEAIPRWCDGHVTVHIMGGGAWQYPSGKVTVSHFFGGGKIVLAAWGGGGYTLKRMEILNNSLVVDVQDAYINACAVGDCFHVENSVVTMAGCRVNGRYVLDGAGSAGFDAAYGAVLMLVGCEAHQCHIAAHAHLGGRIFAENCAGSGNFAGCMATTGGIFQQSYTTFEASTPHFEDNGGKILVQAHTQSAGTPPPATPVEYARTYAATATGCVDMAAGVWTQSPDWIRAGANARGLIWFDTEGIIEEIRGRALVHASVTMRRRGSGGRAGAVPVHLYDLRSRTPGGLFIPGPSHGALGAWGWGEKKTVPLPIAAAEALQRRMSYGFALFADEEVVFEGVSEHAPVLEIVYR